MKAVGCVVIVFAVAVGAFFALAGFLMSRGEDQSALTERVDVELVHVRETFDSSTRGGYLVDYAYQHDGVWYGARRHFSDDFWDPQTPLTACIDPDQARDHVISFRAERCGQEMIVAGLILEGKPTTAPDGP